MQESGCYSGGADVPAQSNALRCRNLLDKNSSKVPWPIRPRRDWAEERARFRLPAAPLHGGRLLVEDSVRCSRAHPRVTAVPKQARTSDPSAPLLSDISVRQGCWRLKLSFSVYKPAHA